MLVDDDSTFQFLGQKLLGRVGVRKEEVHTASNGQQAIDLVSGQQLPDVILLDLNMPIMDGFGFLKAFKELEVPRRQDVRIFVVSSSDSPFDRKRAEELGATGYLIKPLREDALKKALNLETLN